MKLLFKYITITGMTAVLLVAGCRRAGKSDSSEQKSSLMIKAYAAEDKGDYKAALDLYKKTMDTYPQFARPHLDAALLYQERFQDYISAVYHYQRYLEMRPRTEKRVMIKNNIRESKDAFAVQWLKRQGGGSVEELQHACTELRNRNLALSNRLARVQGELDALRKSMRSPAAVAGHSVTESQTRAPAPVVRQPVKVVGIKHAPAVHRADADGSSRPSPVRPAKPATVAEPRHSTAQPSHTAKTTQSVSASRTKANAVPRTYTVHRGETLSLIALRVYGDATLWRKIQRANRDILGSSVQVKVGQVLKIP